MTDKARELYVALYERSYYDFFRDFWESIEPEALTDNWHVKYLCDELQEVGERIIGIDQGGGELLRKPLKHNLIINISPGETKSSISTIFFPVWLWIKDPTIRIITLSYSASLSLFHASRSRDIIRSPKFQELFGNHFQIRKDVDKKSEYAVMYGENMDQVGGIRFTGSVGGSITGKHAHIIIVDDPINAQQAYSDAERETANEFLTSTLNSRKVNEKITPTVLIMQRLHEDDPTARLAKSWEKSGRLKWIRLPADNRYIVNPPELLNHYTEDGELLVMNAIRKPTSVIKVKEAEHTSEDFSGQFGQDPQPAEGNKLKKAWFTQRFNMADLHESAMWERKEIVWNATLDGAYTSIKNNSATGVLVWAIHKKQLYLRDYREWHYEFPVLIPELKSFLNAMDFNTQSTLYVEPKAIGKSLVQVMRSQAGINIIEDPLPEGISRMEGKVMRVDRSTPYIRGMNLFLYEGVDWEPFIKQCATFPKATHTDLVDVLTMAVEKIDMTIDLSDLSMWGSSTGV